MPYGYDDCPACGRHAPYCAECREHVYRQQWSYARHRGARWADYVLQRLGRADQPWPDTPRARAMAQRFVDDDGDEQLRARLIAVCMEAAAERWLVLMASEEERRRVLDQQRIRFWWTK